MYQSNRKRAYLLSPGVSSATKKSAERLFEVTAEYELKYGADLSELELPDIQHVVDEILGMRLSSKWAKMVILRDYAEWCMATNYPKANNNISKVNLLGLDKLRDKLISGPGQLSHWMDKIFYDINDEKVDLVYMGYLWFAFSGVPEEVAISLTKDNIDFRTLSIRVGDKSYPIYRESIAVINMLIELETFAYHNPNYKTPTNGTVRRNRVDGETLMRGLRGSPKITDIRQYLVSFIAKAGAENGPVKKITFSKVRLSGFFYRIRECESAEKSVDFKLFAAQYHEIAQEDVSVKKLREFSDDYNRWKIAFR